jgi:NAD(P)-dependent dehydrogenase (short-subunit alcohol dehydrogenase family)
VYAGCLTPKGVEALREFAPGVLVPLLLDVTKQEQINDVMAHIAAEEPHGLYALVNNAGAWFVRAWAGVPWGAGQVGR